MTFEEIMNEQRKDKEIVDGLQIPYLGNQDIDVCNYVSDQLSKVELLNTRIAVGKKISFEEMVDVCLDEISIFDNDLFFEMLDIINQVSIHKSNDNFGFGTYVNYECDLFGNVPVFGRVSAYVVPKNLYEISTIFFSHEQIHALKDTVYYEYTFNKTLGETIPMFYELISCGENEKLRTQVLKLRLKYLLDNNTEYILFNDMIREKKFEYSNYGIKGTLEDIELYNFIRSRVGCYLNSYYYAIMLYHLYKEKPKMILDLVARVLRQEMTTFNMLNLLGIYGDVRGEVFEKELDNVKKLVK